MTPWRTGFVAAILMSVACVPAPTDPVATGTLCLPSSAECPDEVLISRGAVGRNQLDYALVNDGTTETTVIAQATVPASDDDTGADATDAGSDAQVDGDGEIIIAREEHRIAPQTSIGNRWTPQLLGTRDPIEFSIACSGCEVRADFVLSTIPLECSTDDDCSSGWLCDTRVPGRCVECRSDEDCSSDQTCDLDRGRCDPPTASSCSTSGTDTLPILLALLLILGIRRARTIHVAAPVLVVLLLTPDAHSEPPIASLGVGVGTHIFTGDVGDVTEPGLSLSLAQELRWQYVGLSLGITTSYFLTDQPSPPFSRDLRTASVLAGPRGYLPLGPLELVAGLDYVRLGLDSNSLIRITGPDLSYNAANLSGGIRYRWSGLEIRTDFGYQTVFDFPGDLVWLQFGVAIASGS